MFKKLILLSLFVIFFLPQVYMAFQITDDEKKITEAYETFSKLKNNFKSEKFWSGAEAFKGKEKIKYDEFDEIKKNLIKQIILRTCKNSITKEIEDIEKNKKDFKELLIKLKEANSDLEKMERELRLELYEIKPDWFTNLDKEIFLELKK